MPIGPNPGLSPAVQEALQRRSGAQPQLSQTSPSAPMQQQAPQPAQPSEMTQASAPTDAPAAAKPPTSESEMIIKALTDRLKFNSKTETQAQEFAMGGGNPRVSNFSHSGLTPIPKNMQ